MVNGKELSVKDKYYKLKCYKAEDEFELPDSPSESESDRARERDLCLEFLKLDHNNKYK